MVIGLSKRGEINDIAFKESYASTKETCSECHHHITTLLPADDMTKISDFWIHNGTFQWFLNSTETYNVSSLN